MYKFHKIEKFRIFSLQDPKDDLFDARPFNTNGL